MFLVESEGLTSGLPGLCCLYTSADQAQCCACSLQVGSFGFVVADCRPSWAYLQMPYITSPFTLHHPEKVSVPRVPEPELVLPTGCYPLRVPRKQDSWVPPCNSKCLTVALSLCQTICGAWQHRWLVAEMQRSRNA